MLIVFTAIAAAAVYAAAMYNALMSLRNRANNAWADIEVQLKRRHDLVPNLVSTVEAYASHEKEVLEGVTELRQRAVSCDKTQDHGRTESQLSTAIKTVFAVAEQYPDLKADENYQSLQNVLATLENNISCARRYYNAVVRDLNTKRQKFPSNLVADCFSVGPYPYFQAGQEARAPVRIRMVDKAA